MDWRKGDAEPKPTELPRTTPPHMSGERSEPRNGTRQPAATTSTDNQHRAAQRGGGAADEGRSAKGRGRSERRGARGGAQRSHANQPRAKNRPDKRSQPPPREPPPKPTRHEAERSGGERRGGAEAAREQRPHAPPHERSEGRGARGGAHARGGNKQRAPKGAPPPKTPTRGSSQAAAREGGKGRPQREKRAERGRGRSAQRGKERGGAQRTRARGRKQKGAGAQRHGRKRDSYFQNGKATTCFHSSSYVCLAFAPFGVIAVLTKKPRGVLCHTFIVLHLPPRGKCTY